MAQSLWHKGEESYEHIIERPGYYTQIYKGFHDAGNCLYHLGKNQKAIAAYNQALRYHPYSISDLARKAAAADKIGDYDLVIKSLTLCEQIYPFSWKVAYNLADAYQRTGKPEQALPYYQQAWKRNKKLIPIFLQLVRNQVILGNTKEASKLIKQMKNRKMKPEERLYLSRLKKIITTLQTEKARKTEKSHGQKNQGNR